MSEHATCMTRTPGMAHAISMDATAMTHTIAAEATAWGAMNEPGLSEGNGTWPNPITWIGLAY